MPDEPETTEKDMKPDEEHLAPPGAVQEPETARPERHFVRFSLLFRLQHIGLFVSCLALIVTGIPLRFAHTSWAAAFFRAVGGVEASGLIHRAGAALLILVGVFHLVYTVAFREGRSNFMELLPKVKDVRDVMHNVLYFFGFAGERPKFARFSYFEKFDYWAVYWGMVIMIGSGLVLWFSTRAMALLPKVWMDVAHEAHSDEGLLATLAIVVWHFYNVHFSPDHWPGGNLTWWHGKMTERQMLHHHAAELEKITALDMEPEPDKPELPEDAAAEAPPAEPEQIEPDVREEGES